MYGLTDNNPENVLGPTSEIRLRKLKSLLEQPESLRRLTKVCFRLVENYGNDPVVSREIYSGHLDELNEEGNPTVVISDLEAWVIDRMTHLQIEHADRAVIPVDKMTNLFTLYYPD